jgi:hydantoinase/carbamoylase family amidase
MVSSGVWAGDIALEDAHNLEEVNGGATMKSELSRIGYLGKTPASYKSTPMAAHFELHIEQGPILEAENRKIGIVKGVQAYKWFTIEVKGRGMMQNFRSTIVITLIRGGIDSHTGTTPFSNRSDALLTTSKLILQSHRLAASHGALASTGILNLKPGSTNTVPGFVKFSLDIRAASDDIVERLEKELKAAFNDISKGTGDARLNDGCIQGKPCEVTWRLDFASPATIFHDECIDCVRKAAKSIFGSETEAMTKDMTSGAGHDSVYTSRHVPTSMIFVPSRAGISHNPSEYTKPEDCALGAQVLMQSAIRFDQMRTKGASISD